MFLYRDEYYNAETEDKGIVELIVAKQREGKLGRIKHAWMPQYQRIANLDFEYEGTYRQDTFKK
jgi:replicative DNA helicase